MKKSLYECPHCGSEHTNILTTKRPVPGLQYSYVGCRNPDCLIRFKSTTTSEVLDKPISEVDPEYVVA